MSDTLLMFEGQTEEEYRYALDVMDGWIFKAAKLLRRGWNKNSTATALLADLAEVVQSVSTDNATKMLPMITAYCTYYSERGWGKRPTPDELYSRAGNCYENMQKYGFNLPMMMIGAAGGLTHVALIKLDRL